MMQMVSEEGGEHLTLDEDVLYFGAILEISKFI